MTVFLTCLIGGGLLIAVLLAVDRVGRWRDARWARREAARRAFARHPAQLARRRPRPPGGDDDGEPLSEEDLNEYAGILMASGYDGWDGNQAQDTSASEDTE